MRKGRQGGMLRCGAMVLMLAAASTGAMAGSGKVDPANHAVDITVFFTEEPRPSAAYPKPLDTWKEYFQKFSDRLYTSTNGQQRLRKVNVYVRAAAKKDDADVVFGPAATPGGNAHVGGIGQPGRRIFLPLQRIDPASLRAADLSLIHEWGHYCFSLYDEYFGYWVPQAKKDNYVWADGTEVKNAHTHCGLTTATYNKCIMSGPSSAANPLGWCNLSWHNTGVMSGGKWTMTKQEMAWNVLDGTHNVPKPCLTHLMRLSLKDDGTVFVNASPTTPTGTLLFDASVTTFPTVLKAAPAIDWNLYSSLFRAVTCVDRSGSMGDTVDGIKLMSYAKSGTKLMVDMMEPRTTITTTGDPPVPIYQDSDWAGVVAYSSGAYVQHPLVEIGADDAAAQVTKTSLYNAVNALYENGSTNIGGGLRVSMNQHLSAQAASGKKGAGRIILLLSDGQHNTGENPSTVIPELTSHTIKVYTIGLGAGVDRALMASIADQTGGKYRYVGNATALSTVFQDLFGEVKGGLLQNESVVLPAGEMASESIMADSHTDRIVFTLASPNMANLHFSILSPSGKAYSSGTLSNGVTYEEGAVSKIFRVITPEVGQWRQFVTNTLSPLSMSRAETDVEFSLSATVDSPLINLTAETNKVNYEYPEPLLLTSNVTAGMGVAGVDVKAHITKPNGGVSVYQLYDDGLLEHGDFIRNDGIYSTMLYFRADGAYSVRMVATNETGFLAREDRGASSAEDMGDNVPDDLVAPFLRETSLSFNYAGLEVRDEFLRVDKWRLARNKKKPVSDTLQIKGEFATGQKVVDPLVSGINFIHTPSSRWWGVGAYLTPEDFTKAKRGAKYKYKGDTTKGAFLMNVGGSGRNKFSVKSSGSYSILEAQTWVNVEISSGDFSDENTAIGPTLLGPDGAKGSIFNIKKDFYWSPELFVDAYVGKNVLNKSDKDTMRLAMRFPGAPHFDPQTDSLLIDLEFALIEVEPGLWKSNKNGSKLTYIVKGTQGSKSKMGITIWPEKRVLSLKIRKANLPALNEDTLVGIDFGTFTKVNGMTLGAKRKDKSTTMIY